MNPPSDEGMLVVVWLPELAVLLLRGIVAAGYAAGAATTCTRAKPS